MRDVQEMFRCCNEAYDLVVTFGGGWIVGLDDHRGLSNLADSMFTQYNRNLE